LYQLEKIGLKVGTGASGGPDGNADQASLVPSRALAVLMDWRQNLGCGTIASGDDYDDVVDWGKAHLAFLRGFAEFHFGIPCADWLCCIMNRIDPKLHGNRRE
jgi:hypothetical protein